LWAYLSSRQLVSLPDLQAVIKLRSGMPGVSARRVLERNVSSGAVSGAELLLHEALEKAGFRGWEAGVRITDQLGIFVSSMCYLPAPSS
jgi:hypothetical protein